MIFNVALAPGTTLASVVYRWIAAGVIDGSATGTGITQPWASEPVFRVVTTPPVGAEEIIIYDSTDLTNWTLGGYRTELAAVGAAAQILLDRKSTRLNSSHVEISYAVFCLKKKNTK